MIVWKQYQSILNNIVDKANMSNFMNYLKTVILFTNRHPKLNVSLRNIPGFNLATSGDFASFKNVIMTLISLSEIKLYYIPNHINIKS